MKKYDHKKIEKKWQKVWEKQKFYETADEARGKENFYALVEFPYPSGNLHVGHWYAFSVPDIFARAKRMQGYNVMFPIGFDAFGLPAENAAIKRGINPRKWTCDNIDYMRRQLRTMGASFDWSREVVTCDPEYYRFTQWIFLQFFKKGLAYQAETPVNWCPSCKTVLANEQVIGGCCERCDSSVEQRKMKQWLLKITDYAEKLLAGLDKLNWPEEIKESQRNWIGRSEGALLKFPISNSQFSIDVFTTRPDTIFGATYMVLAPEHKLISKIKNQISNIKEVEDYIKKAQKKTELQRAALEKEKTGVELKGIKAVNPATKEGTPIWIADYVMMGYGTGAIMAVPAHDERDFEFAKKYNLPIKQVIVPYFLTTEGPDAVRRNKRTIKRRVVYIFLRHHEDDKYLCLDWKNFGWHSGIIGGVEQGEDLLEAAAREIKEEIGYENIKFIKSLGGVVHNHFYARHKNENRYAEGYGLLFELVNEKRNHVATEHTKNHEPVWIEGRRMGKWLNLPQFQYMWQVLTTGKEYFTGSGIVINSSRFSGMKSEKAIPKIAKEFGRLAVQYKLRDWVISRQRYWGVPIPVVHCKDCGVQPVEEKVLPVLLPEIRDYKPRGDGKSPLAKIEKWVEVKCPKCGGMAKRETDTMDTFIDSSWYFLRYTDPKNKKEFASKEKMKKWMPVDRYSGGAEHTTMHLLYSRFWIKAMHDLGLLEWDEPYVVRMNRGLILGPDGQKMSKSRGNVVDPDNYVKELGTDTVRMYLAFIGPYNEVGAYPWDPKGIMGIRRFLEKVWRLLGQFGLRPYLHSLSDIGEGRGEVIALLHRTIKKVTEDIEAFKFNTAISALMILVNEFSNKQIAVSSKQLEILLKLLAPFAPHLTEELWHQPGHKKSIHLEKWPEYDKNLVKEELINLPVQVNGKLRSAIKLAADASEDEAKELASKDKNVAKRLAGKTIKKMIYVKGKIINFVVN